MLEGPFKCRAARLEARDSSQVVAVGSHLEDLFWDNGVELETVRLCRAIKPAGRPAANGC